MTSPPEVSLISIKRFFNVCSFDCTAYNHTGWMTVVAPTDRPISVLNRVVIERFSVVFALINCVLSAVQKCLSNCHTTVTDLFAFLQTLFLNRIPD